MFCSELAQDARRAAMRGFSGCSRHIGSHRGPAHKVGQEEQTATTGAGYSAQCPSLFRGGFRLLGGGRSVAGGPSSGIFGPSILELQTRGWKQVVHVRGRLQSGHARGSQGPHWAVRSIPTNSVSRGWGSSMVSKNGDICSVLPPFLATLNKNKVGDSRQVWRQSLSLYFSIGVV